MSDDIVERLRRELDGMRMKYTGSDEVDGALLADAADEIERLRARVAELEAPPVWASGGNRGVPGLDPSASDS